MGLRAALPFLHTVLDTLLPPHCLTCDALVDAPGRFCPACFRQTSFITAPLCLSCGVPFVHARHDAIVCDDCAIDPPPWGEARAALAYDAHSRRLVLGFKHGDRTELAGALARMMARAGAALRGGTAAWRAAGRHLESGRTVPADSECIDFYLRPYDRNSGIAEAMQAYLSWEIDLVHEIERDGTVRFGA